MKPFNTGIRGMVWIALCILTCSHWMSPSLLAGTLSGQLTASCTFTPYSGTNGTGNVVNDLTLAHSLVFNPGIVGGNPSGSFTGLSGTTNFIVPKPLPVNPSPTSVFPLWRLNRYSFKSGTLSNTYTSPTTIFLNGNGALEDGTNSDATVAAISITFSLGVPATSSQVTLTTSSLTNPVPVLGIVRSGTNAVLSWSTNSQGFTLQSTPSLSFIPAPIWTFLTNPVFRLGTNYVVTNPISGLQKYYRLAY
jgi:hypothetical protein